MNDQQLLTLWVGSFRYYLGRQTYAVSDFCDLLIQEWENLPANCKSIIQRDLNEAFDRDDRSRDLFAGNGSKMWALGDDCDRAQWEKIKELYTNEK